MGTRTFFEYMWNIVVRDSWSELGKIDKKKRICRKGFVRGKGIASLEEECSLGRYGKGCAKN